MPDRRNCLHSPQPQPSPSLPPPPAPPTPTEAELICDMKAMAVEYAAGVLREGADLQVVSDALQMGLCPGKGRERSVSTPLARHDGAAACVHVSAETGHDGAPGEGSVAQPFQTLPYAVAQCRARRAARLEPAPASCCTRSPRARRRCWAGGEQPHHPLAPQRHRCDLQGRRLDLDFQVPRRNLRREPTRGCIGALHHSDLQGCADDEGALPEPECRDGNVQPVRRR